MKLQEKVALVTGAGHRIGRAIALALAGEGASVVVHYGTSREGAEQTAGAICGLGPNAWTLSADLRRPDACNGLVEEVGRLAGRLDVLVNSAASFERRPFDEIDADAWDEVQAVNLRAPFLLTREAARVMRRSSRAAGETAAVINLSDLSAVYPWPGFAHHGVSKAGLLHLTRTAARELAPDVRVNAVIPGAILPPPGVDADSDEWRATAERLPLARVGDPELIGRTVCFLAGTEFITGVAVPVDGGEHLIGAGDRS